jgi:hypothetical protein
VGKYEFTSDCHCCVILCLNDSNTASSCGGSLGMWGGKSGVITGVGRCEEDAGFGETSEMFPRGEEVSMATAS